MTTERMPSPKPSPKPAARGLSGLEWKLYLTAALATAYVVVWLAAAPSAPSAAAAADPNAVRPEGPADPAPNRWAKAPAPTSARTPPAATATPTPRPTATTAVQRSGAPPRLRTRSS